MNGAKAPEPPSPVYQEKTVTPETLPVTVSADEGYDALGEVTVNPDPNLTKGNIKKGVEIFGITGTYDNMKPEDAHYIKPISFPLEVWPEEGHALSYVQVSAPDGLVPSNIKSGEVIAGVTGSYEGGAIYPKVTVTPDHFPLTKPVPNGYVGIEGFTVNKPTDLIPENIPLGKSICGVEGSYEQIIPDPVLETVDILPKSFPTIVNPSEGYDGIGKVTVMSPDHLVAENIKAGVTIAGIEGTYDNTTPVEEKTVQATAFPTVVEPQSGHALSKVTVTAPENLSAENIASGVTIAGVTGTFEGTPGMTLYEIPSNRITLTNPSVTTGFSGYRAYVNGYVKTNGMVGGSVAIKAREYVGFYISNHSNNTNCTFVSFDLGLALNTMLAGVTIPDGTYRPAIGLQDSTQSGASMVNVDTFIKVTNGQFASSSVQAYSYGSGTTIRMILYCLYKWS